MYRVKVWDSDGNTYPLHDLRDPELSMIDPVLSLELNKTGTFNFTITPSHPYGGKIEQMVSEIGIFRDNEELPFYVGRPLPTTEDLYGLSAVTCEGVLAYLLDSIVRPYEYTGSIRGFLEQLINSHNAQVEEKKRFILGDVTVADSNNYINRSNSDYSKTLDAINDKLINTHGGYIRVRFEADGRYIDYLSDYGHVCSQVIEFGENLLDFSRVTDPSTLITGIIPLGAETEEEGINGTRKRVDITSVNDDKDYLVNESAAAHYGYIFGTVTFNDVTLPENLKKKAEAYLEENCSLVQTLELTAIDLHHLHADTEKLSLGDWVRAVSPPHNLDKIFILSSQTLHLTHPEDDIFILGKSLKKMTVETNKAQGEITDYVIQTAKETSSALLAAIENATELITGGKGGYVVLDRAEDGHPQGILIMDHPSVEDAKNVIQINKNGIGFSNAGIAGPYRNAWTIDGNLVASFITSGTMSADRIWAGMLQSINGASKINLDTGEAELAGHYKITDPATLAEVGGIRWDTNGAGTTSEAKDRVFFYTGDGRAMKIESPSKLSISGSELVYITSDTELVLVIGGVRWRFDTTGIYCDGVLVVEKP